jgi:hypothetical protein
VLSDSSKLVSADETHATMTVLEFPKIPKESSTI